VVALISALLPGPTNQTEKLQDVTAHAEMLALTAAANHLGNKYRIDCTLYVKPWSLCGGALAPAPGPRWVVYGAG
jgi:tRNA(adenine34) deaminase